MFKCNQCGECCRHLDRTNLYPWLNRGDGVCRYLKDNKCSIYAERPLLCRVDESYEAYFKDFYTLEEFYEMNYQVCNRLKNEKEGR